MDRKGVSPVIATILMVSIIVVLAAVLYVLVVGEEGGFGDDVTYSGIISVKTTGYDDGVMIYIFEMDNGHFVEVSRDTWNYLDEGQWYQYSASQIR